MISLIATIDVQIAKFWINWNESEFWSTHRPGA